MKIDRKDASNNDGLKILLWTLLVFFALAGGALIIEKVFFPKEFYESGVIL